MSDEIEDIPIERWNAALRDAGPATDDDVSITKDGRRLDTPEKLLAFIAELDAERERLSSGAAGRST